jgi:hypothetical protein
MQRLGTVILVTKHFQAAKSGLTTYIHWWTSRIIAWRLKQRKCAASESTKCCGMRASSASFSAVAVVFFDLPASVEPPAASGGREDEQKVHVIKESERREGGETIYGVLSRYVPAYPLFSPCVILFPRCSPTPAPSRTPKSSVPREKSFRLIWEPCDALTRKSVANQSTQLGAPHAVDQTRPSNLLLLLAWICARSSVLWIPCYIQFDM